MKMDKLVLCAEAIDGTDVDIMPFQINFVEILKKLLTKIK